MLTRLARLATSRARWVLVGAAVFFVVAGAIGGGVADRMISGGFEDPSSESSRAEEVLADEFDTGVPNVLLLVTTKVGDVDSLGSVSAGQDITQELADQPHVTNVFSYWSEGNAPPLRSEDGTRALVLGRIDATDDSQLNDYIEEIGPRLEQDAGPVTVEVGGVAEVFREVNVTIEEDLVRAELIALPITLVLLVLVFGSVVSAVLPLIVGVLSIVGTFLALRLLTEVTDVSIYALNLTTAMGLGLAIDYSMFIVARYREELRGGHEPKVAVTRTVRSAGRTVAFSAATVAASLCAALVFPFTFLRSMAYAGLIVSLMAGLFSLVVLPAILMALGHRVNSLTLWKRSVNPPEEGMWHRIALLVMRRPIPVATVVIALLLVMGSPFLGLQLRLPDDRVLPESASSRQVHDVIRDEFTSTEAGALSVVAASTGGLSGGDLTAAVDEYAATLAVLPSVSRVDAATGSYCGAGLAEQLGCEPGQLVLGPDTAPRYDGFTQGDGTYLSVVPSVEPMSDEGEDLVNALRSSDAPFPVTVTGLGAELVDSNDALFSRLPLALLIIGVITVVLLFMMFGSVLIPVKALVLNLLSLTATFGAMVWIFQDGHLSGVLDFTATGGLAAAMPILMFCVAFGLSMDYEVFLLSRIKEEHDKGVGNTRSVALGLERTGRIVTAAAVLIAVVFLAFATGGVSFMKLFGIGLTLAVLLDAFVIRGTLVPAFMRLAGEWNWWAPGPLRRFHQRFGISEHVDLDELDRADAARERETVGSDAVVVS
ncbi:MAG TPA: MMPL family transporter [Acidimicrobiales bacterium]|nr:MMPL family transporter [Acidimicrobiales bacterium]